MLLWVLMDLVKVRYLIFCLEKKAMKVSGEVLFEEKEFI